MAALRNGIQQSEFLDAIFTFVENETISATEQAGHIMISDETKCPLGNQAIMEEYDRAEEGENRNEEDQYHMGDLEASHDRVKVSEGVNDRDDSVHNSTITFEAVNPQAHNNLQLDCSSWIKEFCELTLPGANSKLLVGDQVEEDQTREIGVTAMAKGANISDAEQVNMTPVVKTTEEMLMEATQNADTDGLDIFSPNVSTPRQPEDDVLAPEAERRAHPDTKSYFSGIVECVKDLSGSQLCYIGAGALAGAGYLLRR